MGIEYDVCNMATDCKDDIKLVTKFYLFVCFFVAMVFTYLFHVFSMLISYHHQDTMNVYVECDKPVGLDVMEWCRGFYLKVIKKLTIPI